MALDEDVPIPRVLQQTLISEQEEYPEEKEINAKIKEKKFPFLPSNKSLVFNNEGESDAQICPY